MAIDTSIYPDQYDSSITDTGSSALDTAVKGLQSESRIQAIRLALSRRSASILAAAQQNSGVIVLGSLMPITVDPDIRNQPPTQTATSGTVGYVFGTANGDFLEISASKITNATDTFSFIPNGSVLGRRMRGSASRLISGFLAGGGTSQGSGAANEIEEFLFATQSSSVLAAVVYRGSTYWHSTAAYSGFSSTRNAYMLEGWTKAAQRISMIAFESKTCVVLNSMLQPVHHATAESTPSSAFIFTSRSSHSEGSISSFQFASESIGVNSSQVSVANGLCRQSLGNGIHAWIFAGNNANNIHRYNVSSMAFTQLTATMPQATGNAGRVGSSVHGYLCGGTPGVYHQWNSWYTNSGISTAHKFVFATETMTAISSMSVSRSHPAGLSDFSGAFV